MLKKYKVLNDLGHNKCIKMGVSLLCTTVLTPDRFQK